MVGLPEQTGGYADSPKRLKMGGIFSCTARAISDLESFGTGVLVYLE